ncbi:hypothetical protein NM688_g2604 [Phlebia brevispora]|uniref:Uncharacterized protein n=1 Tax=Phlebia brevispora TaxID=194682 RepID=A0ACC1T8I1_9APHY|nr:hypothetical protein NM688_g2604 [Phlebia brevispora]
MEIQSSLSDISARFDRIDEPPFGRHGGSYKAIPQWLAVDVLRLNGTFGSTQFPDWSLQLSDMKIANRIAIFKAHKAAGSAVLLGCNHRRRCHFVDVLSYDLLKVWHRSRLA